LHELSHYEQDTSLSKRKMVQKGFANSKFYMIHDLGCQKIRTLRYLRIKSVTGRKWIF